jgi:MASE9 protein
MQNTSRAAQWFIGFMTLCGVAALGSGFLKAHSMHYVQFVALLVIGIVGSRLKVKLPGVTGNMSVNLPFILMATLQLSLFEALIIGLSSTAAQCLPTKSSKPSRVQVLFNLSTMSVAVAVAGLIAHGRMPFSGFAVSGALALVLAGATFFLFQTVPVATIISLTEGGTMLRIWHGIVRLSFPYYVLSAGVTSIATTLSHNWGWLMPLLVMLTMYGVYRSYTKYFGTMMTPAPVKAYAAAAAGR